MCAHAHVRACVRRAHAHARTLVSACMQPSAGDRAPLVLARPMHAALGARSPHHCARHVHVSVDHHRTSPCGTRAHTHTRPPLHPRRCTPQVPVLHTLSQAQLFDIARRMEMVNVPAGQVVFRQGDVGARVV